MARRVVLSPHESDGFDVVQLIYGQLSQAQRIEMAVQPIAQQMLSGQAITREQRRLARLARGALFGILGDERLVGTLIRRMEPDHQASTWEDVYAYTRAVNSGKGVWARTIPPHDASDHDAAELLEPRKNPGLMGRYQLKLHLRPDVLAAMLSNDPDGNPTEMLGRIGLLAADDALLSEACAIACVQKGIERRCRWNGLSPGETEPEMWVPSLPDTLSAAEPVTMEQLDGVAQASLW